MNFRDILMIAATQGGGAAAYWDPAQEYSPDVGFDNPGVWTGTPTKWAVTGSEAVCTGGSGTCTATAAATMLPGTYRMSGNCSSWSSASIRVYLDGVVAGTFITATGAFSFDVVKASFGSQFLGFSSTALAGCSISDLSVKRIA
jgi:hypothetical protein